MVPWAVGRPTSPRRAMRLGVVALLAALAVLLLGGVGPASAHKPLEESFVLAPPTTLPVSDTSVASEAAGSYESPAMFWPIALMVFVGSAALARRRAQRLVVPALVAVLTVFGVESAQHSVHHVFDGAAVACPIASIAGHLNGTTIEGLAVEAPMLLVGAILATPDPGISPLSPFGPPHGRAPPSALV
jgi:hypothetical protein